MIESMQVFQDKGRTSQHIKLSDSLIKTTPLMPDVLSEEPDLTEAVLAFIDGLPKRFSELNNAYEQRDWSKLHISSHNLRSSKAFGYPILSQIADRISNATKTNSAKDIETAIQEFATILTRIEAAKPMITWNMETTSFTQPVAT